MAAGVAGPVEVADVKALVRALEDLSGDEVLERVASDTEPESLRLCADRVEGSMAGTGAFREGGTVLNTAAGGNDGCRVIAASAVMRVFLRFGLPALAACEGLGINAEAAACCVAGEGCV